MAEISYNFENETWEELRRKSRRRRHHDAHQFTVRSFFLIIVGLLCVVGCVLGFSVAAHHSQPLTLPSSVKVGQMHSRYRLRTLW